MKVFARFWLNCSLKLLESAGKIHVFGKKSNSSGNTAYMLLKFFASRFLRAIT